MKVCFPVLVAHGLESEVYGHFGSAPVFLVVETDKNDFTIITNKDQHHTHGECNPMKALNNHGVDAIVVGSRRTEQVKSIGDKGFSSAGVDCEGKYRIVKNSQSTRVYTAAVL